MNVTSHFARGQVFKAKPVFITGDGIGINLGIASNFAALGTAS